MNIKPIRVRFAPSPTGLMHLGNVRTALLNFLFARQKNGTFVLRIEDTDPSRNFDPQAQNIIQDLNWLDLQYDEGPHKEGKYKPYFQSERNNIHQEMFNKLKDKELVYRCFCTAQDLEKKRHQQLALKMPPRYDRTCIKLSDDEIKEKLEKKTPFIWRMKINSNTSITVQDLARGPVTFNLKNFSDFPLTRQDGSFTFIFANAVDDALMEITHVLRGEDHLTNTANQAVLYKALEFPLPLFWHLPILCNSEGKKLSKRDFGFSLKDLKQAGFLPEALVNYLAIIGGGKFEKEIMSLDELIKFIDFNNINSTGHVRYDVEKLHWVNHKWIDQYDSKKLLDLARPFIEEKYPQAKQIDDSKLNLILQKIKTDITTLQDIPNIIGFYFESPLISRHVISEHFNEEQQEEISDIIKNNISYLDKPETFVKNIKNSAKTKNIPLKVIFSAIRLALTGSIKGPSINDLFEILESDKTTVRLELLISILK